ncbi:MAG: DnaJ domain-containing protein [Woeseiaceae bacterium]
MDAQLDNLTYYELLQVARTASADAIRENYRRLMQSPGIHPDRGGDPKRAALINKAYAVLSDPAQRTEYDAQFNVIDLVARGIKFSHQQEQPVPADSAPEGQCLFCKSPHECVDLDDVQSTCANCGSPVASVTRHLFETADHRAIHRIGKSMALRFYTRWPQERLYAGWTEDISLNGLRMVTRCPLSAGQRIRIASNMLHAVGIVVHCETRRSSMRREYVAGIAFETLRLARSSGGFLSRLA